MSTTADKICRTMVNPVTAVEIARQMNLGVGGGNADLLCKVGVSATPAIEWTSSSAASSCAASSRICPSRAA